jgi:hypothetical protein
VSGLFLDDAEPPPPKRGRPRWVDGLGLTAVVLGMVAVGVLGDRGSRDDGPPATSSTTTSTVATTTAPLPPPSTTTTVRFAPLATPTRTRLLLLQAGSRSSVVVDVDAGTSQPAPSAITGVDGVGTTAGLLGLRNGVLSLVRLSADLRTTQTEGRPLPAREYVLAPVGRSGAWVTAQDGVEVVTDLVGPDGTDTGKVIRLRPQAFVAAGFPDGVVVDQGGSLTWVPVTGRPRPLGNGSVFGAGDGRIVRNSCVELRCRLDVVEVRTGAARPVTGIPEVQASARPVAGSAVGGDGTWVVAAGFDAADGYAFVFTVDLRTGAARVLNRGGAGFVATAVEGPWVFQVDDVRHALVAYDHRTGDEVVVRSLDDLDVTGLVALPLP